MKKFNWLCEFKESAKEKAFQLEKYPYVKVRLQLLYFFSAVVYLLAAYEDHYELGSGEAFQYMLASRVIVGVIGLASLFFLSFSKAHRNIHYSLMGFYMSSLLLAEAFEVYIKSASVGAMSVPGTVFIVLSYYIILPPKMLISLISGVGGSIAYLLVLHSVAPDSSTVLVNSLLFFGLANFLGLNFLVSFGKSQRREFLARSELKRLVEIDELTGVFSRRRVLEIGKSLFKSALRFDNTLSVLMLDIDHFKKVNDEYGHHIGDIVLAEVADRCSRVLREVDVLGRLGGEEFAVVLPHSNLDQAVMVAERLRSVVWEAPFAVDGGYLPVTVSIGVTELGRHADFQSMLQGADVALYQAKDSGRNQVCPFVLRAI